jgi:hypothetical protein
VEFVSKKKKLRLNVDSTVWEFNSPTVLDQEILHDKLKDVEAKDAAKVYYEFFESQLGLPQEASKSMDFDDFLKFVEFIFSPKKSL